MMSHAALQMYNATHVTSAMMPQPSDYYPQQAADSSSDVCVDSLNDATEKTTSPTAAYKADKRHTASSSDTSPPMTSASRCIKLEKGSPASDSDYGTSSSSGTPSKSKLSFSVLSKCTSHVDAMASMYVFGCRLSSYFRYKARLIIMINF